MRGSIRALRNVYVTAGRMERVSFICPYASLAVRRACGIKGAEFWRCTPMRRVKRIYACACICGCHGVATCLARYAPIASPEREPNKRPALSKDKGGNSARQIIEWPDSASLSRFVPLSSLSHLDFLSFLSAPAPRMQPPPPPSDFLTPSGKSISING